ncbi:MAG: helix-turn-helix domain-containing protein [Stellaceae bacterium]
MITSDEPHPRQASLGTLRKRRRGATDLLVGKRLRSARALAGLSQKALGIALGVSFHAINKYEKGHNRMSGARIAAASRALQVPLSYFFEEDPPAPVPEPGVPTILSPVEVHVLRYFRGIKTELQDDLLRIMRRMSQRRGARAE